MIKLHHLVHSWLERATIMSLPSTLPFTPYGVSGAIMLGEDCSSPAANSVTVFTEPNNLPIAIASILNQCQNMAHFHPTSQTPFDVAYATVRYLREVDNTPFFHMSLVEQEMDTFDISNQQHLMDKLIFGLDLADTDDTHVGKIHSAISSLGAIMSSVGAQHILSFHLLFMVIDLRNYSDPSIMILGSTPTQITYLNAGQNNITEKKLTLSSVKYSVLPQIIRLYAPLLSQIEAVTMPTLLDNCSSPNSYLG